MAGILGTNPSSYSLNINITPPGAGTFPINASSASFATLTAPFSSTTAGRPLPQWQSQPPALAAPGGFASISAYSTASVSGTFAVTLGPYLLTGATGNQEITGGVFNAPF
jgi:hypothetical protein